MLPNCCVPVGSHLVCKRTQAHPHGERPGSIQELPAASPLTHIYMKARMKSHEQP